VGPVRKLFVSMVFDLCSCHSRNFVFQEVCDLIKPAIEVDRVDVFLLDHINADLSIIRRALGKSKDDVLLLLHSILYHMVTAVDDSEYSQ
jgi:hypothetical protein